MRAAPSLESLTPAAAGGPGSIERSDKLNLVWPKPWAPVRVANTLHSTGESRDSRKPVTLSEMIWEFGPYELDEPTYQLRRRGRLIRIEPKVFDVLLHLIRNRERVVSKNELLDTLWAGEAVSDSVLPRCIAAARRALRDDRSRQKWIQTAHGRGYRFVADATPRDSTPAAQSQSIDRHDPPKSQPTSDFVGRDAALTRLRASLEQATSGRGRVVFLAGEPGIGKTRTADQLGAEAELTGVQWLSGRCYEGEGAPAFWPWLQVLRALVARSSAEHRITDLGAGIGEIAELLPEIAIDSDRPPGPATGIGDSGEQARFRLFESIAHFLTRAAHRHPLLIRLDDLHWADPDSLELFEFLAKELRAAPILLLASFRDVEVRRDHPLRSILGSLAREPQCERLALRGLERDEVSALVVALTETVPTPDLLDALTAMTEGNPFFVREIVTLLAEEGRLNGADSGSDHELITLSLPQGVRDAIGRRLDSLSGECNELLQLASVIGRDFDTRLLERVASSKGDALLELLGEAEAAGVLAEVTDRSPDRGPERPFQFAFTHALLRQTLYEELRASRRVALHRRVGEALEAVFANRPDAPVSELAHHFFEAVASGTTDQAVQWSVSAAEISHGLLAYGESARHYARAVEALEYAIAPDPTRRCELLISWGNELRTGGARDAGRARLGEAAEVARQLGRADLLAQAAIGYRGFGEMGVPPDAKTLSLLEEARDSIGESHPALRSRLLARLTGTPPYANSMRTREELSQQAWAIASELGDPVVLLDAIGARYWATLGPDRIDERLTVGRDARQLAQRLDDPQLSLMAYEIELGAYLMLGDQSGADKAITAYAALADELRQPASRFIASIMLASREMNTGAFDVAAQHIRTALEDGRNAVPVADLLYAGQVYWLEYRKGAIDGLAESMLDVAERLRVGFSGVAHLVDVLIASIHASAGDLEAAQPIFDEVAAQDFEDLEHDEHWMIGMSQLSQLAFQLGDSRRGEQLRALLIPYEGLIVSHDLLRTVEGSVHAILGQLSTLTGQHDEAVACYERALEQEAALGMPPSYHASEAGLARALEGRNAEGDVERARSLWESAERGYRQLGAQLPARFRQRVSKTSAI